MVLGKLYRIVIGTAVFALISVLFSCDELVIVDCTECEINEPLEAYLQIKVDSNQSGVLITIYEGIVQDSVVFMRFPTFKETVFQRVPLNKQYTLTGEYLKGEKKYVVVNSVVPRVVLEEAKCNDPCYYVYNDIVDLRLKYE
jgi:hypothetical protein